MEPQDAGELFGALLSEQRRRLATFDEPSFQRVDGLAGAVIIEGDARGFTPFGNGEAFFVVLFEEQP